MSAVIEIRDAFKIFASHDAAAPALQGLTLTVEPEEIVVVKERTSGRRTSVFSTSTTAGRSPPT
jgi:hypothetical protein